MRIQFEIGTLYILCVSSAMTITSNLTNSDGRGCYYKGRFQTESWEDGCSFRCRCLNPQTGHYRCHKRCPNATAVPPGCTVQPSRADECCSEVVCSQQGILSKSPSYPPINVSSSQEVTTQLTTTVPYTEVADSAMSGKPTSGNSANDGNQSDDSGVDSPQESQPTLPSVQNDVTARIDTTNVDGDVTLTGVEGLLFDNDAPTDGVPFNVTGSTKKSFNGPPASGSDSKLANTNPSSDAHVESVTNISTGNETSSNDDDSVPDVMQETTGITVEVVNPPNDSVKDPYKTVSTTSATTQYNHTERTVSFQGYTFPYILKDKKSSKVKERRVLLSSANSNNSIGISAPYLNDYNKVLSLHMEYNVSKEMHTPQSSDNIKYISSETPKNINLAKLRNKKTKISKGVQSLPNASAININEINVGKQTDNAMKWNGQLSNKRLGRGRFVTVNDHNQKSVIESGTTTHKNIAQDPGVQNILSASMLTQKTSAFKDPLSLNVSKSSTEQDIGTKGHQSGLESSHTLGTVSIHSLLKMNGSGATSSRHVSYNQTDNNVQTREIDVIRSRIHDRQRRLRKTLHNQPPNLYLHPSKKGPPITRDFKSGLRNTTETTPAKSWPNPLLLLMRNPDPRFRRLIFHILKHNRNAVLELKEYLNATDNTSRPSFRDKTIYTATGAVRLKASAIPNVSHGALIPAGSLLRKLKPITALKPAVNPPMEDVCHFKGKSYDTGHTWFDGCKARCVCSDGHKNVYTCRPRCPAISDVPPRCILVVDTADRCCLILYCHHHVTNGPVTTPPATAESSSIAKTFLSSTRAFTTQKTMHSSPTAGLSPNKRKGSNKDRFWQLVMTGKSRSMKSKEKTSRFSAPRSLTPVSRSTKKSNSETFNRRPILREKSGIKPERIISNTTSKGCHINGHIYRTGESWTNGCRFRCFCADEATMMISCVHLCVRWDLPPECTYDPPAAGKCCEVPRCPSGYKIRYPKGYQPE